MYEWKKFDDTLPTENPGEQVDILFGKPGWATFFRGTYTHFPSVDLRERISVYVWDGKNAHCEEWTLMMPTHWFPLPNNPTIEQ